MRSLYNLYEVNAYTTDRVCLSVRVIQLQKGWTDFVEIWYVRYAIGVCPKIVLLKFLQLVLPTWQKNELLRWDLH
jgi:hypothetical protein